MIMTGDWIEALVDEHIGWFKKAGLKYDWDTWKASMYESIARACLSGEPEAIIRNAAIKASLNTIYSAYLRGVI